MSRELDPSVDLIVRDEAIRRRVSHLLEKDHERPRSSLERWADSSLGKFFLTGIVGVALTGVFQITADTFKRGEERREARRIEALLLVDSLGGMLNDGYYRFGRVFDSGNGWDLKSDSARRADSAYAAFNERFERREAVYAARVCALTDAPTTERFWHVADAFKAANPVLREYRAGKENIDGEIVRGVLSRLRDSVFHFTADLARYATAPTSEEQPEGVRCPPPPRK